MRRWLIVYGSYCTSVKSPAWIPKIHVNAGQYDSPPLILDLRVRDREFPEQASWLD